MFVQKGKHIVEGPLVGQYRPPTRPPSRISASALPRTRKYRPVPISTMKSKWNDYPGCQQEKFR